VGVLLGGNYAQVQSSLDNYYQALDNYFDADASGAPPLIGDYVSSSYASLPGFIVFTGKLIRVTTGLNVAIANIGYPLPTASPITIQNLSVQINDPDAAGHAGLTYDLSGTKGAFNTAIVGINNNYTNSKSVVISGSYAEASPTSTTWHYWGTIVRTDGTSFSFNITQDLS